jgi:molecular chaperone DnaJ
VKKKKDYFLILGISRSESAEGVRAAFRKLAKKYHPDKSGSEGTRLFQEMTEAYGVLSDPESRKKYTEQLLENEGRIKQSHSRKTAAKPHSIHEHLGFKQSSRRPIEDRRSSPDEFPTDTSRNFAKFCQRASTNTVELELILSPNEAAKGGNLPAEIPIASSCPACCGSGRTVFFVCPRCGGHGVSKKIVGIGISIPEGIRDGAVLEYRVNHPECHALVRIHVMIR